MAKKKPRTTSPGAFLTLLVTIAGSPFGAQAQPGPGRGPTGCRVTITPGLKPQKPAIGWYFVLQIVQGCFELGTAMYHSGGIGTAIIRPVSQFARWFARIGSRVQP
jgi:hypothetical protein